MIKVGDMVREKYATIRGPTGELTRLEEAADYGIVVEQESINGLEFSTIQWFDYVSGARAGKAGITIHRSDELEEVVLDE